MLFSKPLPSLYFLPVLVNIIDNMVLSVCVCVCVVQFCYHKLKKTRRQYVEGSSTLR